MWFTAFILLIVTLLTLTIYVGSVTQFVTNIVTKQISSSSDLDIKVGGIDIDFPLDIEIRNTVIYDKSVNDTMLSTTRLTTSIKPLPLLRQRIRVQSAIADTTAFNLFTEDNSMTLKIKADKIELPILFVNLNKGVVKIKQLDINSGDVAIILKEVTTEQETDSTSANWSVMIDSIALKDFNLDMQMLPTIDNLNMRIGDGEINSLNLSTEKQELSISSILADYFSVNFYTPSNEYLANYVAPPTVATTESVPWLVTTELLQISNGSALYTQRGYTPTDGLDPSYIKANRLTLKISNFRNYGSDISVPIKDLTGIERSGLFIRKFNGDFIINSDGINLDGFNIYTRESHINLNAFMGNLAFDPTAKQDNKLNLHLTTLLSTNDILTALPLYSDIIEIIPTEQPLMAELKITGDINNIDISKMELYQTDLYNCTLTGVVKDVMMDSTLNAKLQFNGDFINIRFLEDKLLSAEQESIIKLPKFTINGNSNISLKEIDAALNLQTLNGAINANTYINLDSEVYSANLDISSLPINKIVPSIAIDSISTKANIRGSKFDILTPASTLTSRILISQVSYDSIPFDTIMANINIADGVAKFNGNSASDFCNFDIDLASTILNNRYQYTLDSRIDALNLNDLKLLTGEDVLNTQLTINSVGLVDLNHNIYDLNLILDSIAIKTGNHNIYSRDINTHLYSDSTITKTTIESFDLLANFTTNTSIDGLSSSLMNSYNAALRHISEGDLKIDSIHEYLPELALTVDIGRHSIVNRYLTTTGVRFKDFDFDLYNDTTFTLTGKIVDLFVNGILIDSTIIKSNKGDNALFYSLDLLHKKGDTYVQGSTHISGDITANKLNTLFSKKDLNDKYSLYLGVNTVLADSTATVSIYPKNPIIGSDYWTVNDSNYIRYNYTRDNRNKAIRANLRLSERNSYLSFHTFLDTTNTNNINFAIKGIELGEWLTLSPFSPTITGVINTQANLTTRNTSVWGKAHLDITDLVYNKVRVGTFATNLLLELDPKSKITNAYANIIANDKKVVRAEGHINDSISDYPAAMKLTIDSLPLIIINPFIPSNMASISGYLSGDVGVVGDMNSPSINGTITGDSVNLNLPMFGSYLKLPDTELEIENNILNFKNFNITGTNNKSIKLNGDIKFNTLTSPLLNLQLAGSDIEIINSKQSKTSMVFGKGSISLTSSIKGEPSNLNINATLTLLSGSDITYVLQDDVSSIASNSTNEDLVTFTRFKQSNFLKNDSITSKQAFGANVKATLNINSGVQFNVFLTPNGYNKLQIAGSGKLDYTQNLIGDSNLTGRYTLNSGYIKYKPPLISMVNFNFTSGSYLSWNGEIMNPSINIKGTESIKTNVSISGDDSRVVDFTVGLDVSNTLNNLDIALDLSTNDNVTIANQLLSMSAEERATQAMNLMLYGAYTGSDVSSSGSNLYTTPVYSFLEGKVNQWAAQNIKAVDVSIGLNNYDRIVDGESTQTTDYSYEISKSLLDNRFKITIGGSYNTSTTDEEEIALNLINNISFDYQLRKDGNTYLKLFRQNGYESVLEGEVSSMGVGYVYKRKLNNLKQLFRIKGKKRKKENDTKSAEVENSSSENSSKAE